MQNDPTPAEAKAIGITGGNWPYGPNVSAESRRALVDWARPLGLRISRTRSKCPHWLLGVPCPDRRRSGASCTQGNPSLWVDHVTAWNRDGRPAVLVAQPYPAGNSDAGRDAIDASLDPVRALGCTVTVGPTGWYGAGTVWVAITAPGA